MTAETDVLKNKHLAEKLCRENPAVQNNAALKQLFMALEVPNFRVFGPVSRAIVTLINQVIWLEELLNTLLDTSDIRGALTSLAATTPGEFPDSKRELPSYWATCTVYIGAESDLRDLRSLSAILILARLAFEKNLKNVPPRRSQIIFASAIRNFDKEASEHPLRQYLFGIAAQPTLTAIGEKLTNNIPKTEPTASAFSMEWQEQWSPWLKEFKPATVTKPEKPEKPEKPIIHITPPPTVSESEPDEDSDAIQKPHEPNDLPPTGGRRRRTKQRIRKSPRRVKDVFPTWSFNVKLESEDSIADPEPEEDFCPTVTITTPIITAAGEILPDSRKQKALCHQSIRSGNRDLLTQHIDVLSQVEMDSITPLIKIAVGDAIANREIETAAAGITYALIVATMSAPERVLEMPVVKLINDEDEEVLCLTTGSLNRVTLRPASSFKPAPEIVSLYQATQQHFQLPLPPSIVEWLKKLSRLKSFETLSDILSIQELRIRVEEILKPNVPALNNLTRSLARARKYAVARAQEVGNDRVKTSLIAGDDFGLSTAGLYYYAPLVADLQSIYQKSIWPIFGDQP